jgi:hypothetical protein
MNWITPSAGITKKESSRGEERPLINKKVCYKVLIFRNNRKPVRSMGGDDELAISEQNFGDNIRA